MIIVLKLFTFFLESRFSGQKNRQDGFFVPGCGPKRGFAGTPTGAGRGRAQGVTPLLDTKNREKRVGREEIWRQPATLARIMLLACETNHGGVPVFNPEEGR